MPGGVIRSSCTLRLKAREGMIRTAPCAGERSAAFRGLDAGQEQVQILAKAQMTALTQDDSSYLKRDEFGDMEGELLLGASARSWLFAVRGDGSEARRNCHGSHFYGV